MVEERPPVSLKKLLTTTEEEVLVPNFLRRWALLVNDSDSVAYLSLGIPAVSGQGIRVNALGGSYEINKTNPFYGNIHAISTGVSKSLLITEMSD